MILRRGAVIFSQSESDIEPCGSVILTPAASDAPQAVQEVRGNEESKADGVCRGGLRTDCI